MKPTGKRPVQMKCRLIFIFSLSLALALCFIMLPPLSIVYAQEPQVTEEDLLDAILERRFFSNQELERMDFNQDGKLDAADLVKFLIPLANFDTSISETEEGTIASIKVNFSSPYKGVLHYKTSGTAVSGQDYPFPSGSVVANGMNVDIPLSINDDTEIEEEIETIVLEIDYDENQNLGYLPGSTTQHIVYLKDNDAFWDGTIQLHETAIHFRIKIINGADITIGELVTDGFGIIPLRNGTEPDWPAESMALSKDSFLASIQGILVPGSSTLTGTDFQRGFVFQADAEQIGHSVEPDNFIRGTVIETLEFPNNPQFSRTSSGMFTLVKQSAHSDRLLVPLEPYDG